MTTFESLGLRPEILAALHKMGFVTPTDIQTASINHILNSRQDLIALAQTGTGKTGAFSLPVLSRIDETKKTPQVLILCPTRELCLQISKDIKNFLSELPKIKVAAIYGGDSFSTQYHALAAGPQIIVGTPGRMNDMINRGSIKLTDISWLILDEADEMLKMGFKEELDAILKTSPKEKQTLLFSATMDRTIERIAKTYMKNPKEITASVKNQGSSQIDHEYYLVQPREKYEALKRILDVNPDIYGIIFCNTRLETQHIAAKLGEEHYTSAAISGELSQPQREQVMAQFRNRQIRILVATDVAARGIDVKELSHVIHYGMPTKVDHYTHRSGRTGRAHSTGTSVAIVQARERYMLRTIENVTGISFKNKKVPTAKDICTAQLLQVVEKITVPKTDAVDLSEYLPLIEEKLSHLSRTELIHHLASVELGRFIKFYKNLPDLSAPTGREIEPPAYKTKLFEQRPYSPENMARLKVNIGRRGGFSIPKLFETVNSVRSIKGIQIGTIVLESEQTYFEVEKHHAITFVNCLSGKIVNGTKLKAELFGAPAASSGAPAPRGPAFTPKSFAPQTSTTKTWSRSKKPVKK
jgi:ATP-dependent RNA helicase DeaD